MDLLPQLLVNGIISGTLLAIPAIGFNAIFAVLRFPNFSVASLASASDSTRIPPSSAFHF